MANRNFFIILIILLLSSFFSLAQQFGGSPIKTRWLQIHTDSFRIIFPRNLRTSANQVASVIENIPDSSNYTIGSQLRKVNIVLQNQTVLSNGYVGMGPYRSEFQLTPLQNSFRLGSLPWHITLALHEYRHVQQFNNFRQGVSLMAYKILGEEAGALLNSLSVPDWFWEGDAVMQETILTTQGRGRLPSFLNDFKALWAADKEYSWMKLRNGSLRDLVPDHYQLGYMLVRYGREHYGAESWKNITSDAVRFKGIFYPFQRSIRKHTGKSFAKFREGALRLYQSELKTYAAADPAVVIGNQYQHIRSNQNFPQWIDTNSYVYVRRSPKEVPTFVIHNIVTNSDRELRKKDISVDDHFSYRNNTIVYAAYDRDVRWGWRDYSSIRLVNAQTGAQKVITQHSKYFSPEINEAGTTLVAVAINEDASSSLHLLDINGGKTLKIFKNPDTVFYTYPKFYLDRHLISAVRNSRGEMAIQQIDIETGNVEYPVPFSSAVMGFTQVRGDTILYSKTAGPIDRVFMYVSNQEYMLESDHISAATGNYQPSLLEGKWLWTIPTSAGETIVQTRKDNVLYVNPGKGRMATESFPLLHTGNDILPFGLVDTFHTIRPYSKLTRLLNFHSLRPYINDPEFRVSVAGENILNTLQSELFAGYNRNEQSKQLGFFATYAGLFPWIRAGLDYTWDRNALYNSKRVYWNEVQPRIGLSVPLNLIGGRHYRWLTFGSDFVYNKRTYQGIYKDSFDARGYSYLNNYIQFSSQIQKPLQLINPRYAQSISLSWRKAVTRYSNSQFVAASLFYFPGFWRTHSLALQAAFHQRDSGQKIFGNTFPFSRGYAAENFRRMYKAGINYHLPLLYPERGIGSIIYLLRVRAAAFFDYTKVFNDNYTASAVFRSTGTEVYFDTKWWNQQSISFGIRYSRLLDRDLLNRSPNRWELVLPVNITGR